MGEILKQYYQFLDKSAQAYESAQKNVSTKAGNVCGVKGDGGSSGGGGASRSF